MQNGSGIVEVNISDLENAFTLNGVQIVSSGKTIATYQIEYGEDISRLFAVVDYNVQLKTFDFKLVKSDDITSSIEGNIATLVIAMSITGWMGAARSTRGLVLQLKTREFVVASETLGASSGWIIARRLIPNTLGIRVVSITMSLPSVIFYEAFLSYIGLGVTPPQPSWGQLIKAAGETFRYYPYQFIIPCLCVSITMLCFNLIGDGLRDALDPKLRA